MPMAIEKIFCPQKKSFIVFLITYYYSYASAMKQVPTNVPLHSLSSLSKADLSVYDSVDDQVLNDYAVSLTPVQPVHCTNGSF